MHSFSMYICTMSSGKLIKGTLQTIILRLLEENEELYGYEISQKVKELSGGEFVLTEGALYPALHKLEADGFVKTTTGTVDGRIRKYYALSQRGEIEAKEKLNEAAVFIEKLQQVLNLKPSTS